MARAALWSAPGKPAWQASDAGLPDLQAKRHKSLFCQPGELLSLAMRGPHPAACTVAVQETAGAGFAAALARTSAIGCFQLTGCAVALFCQAWEYEAGCGGEAMS